MTELPLDDVCVQEKLLQRLHKTSERTDLSKEEIVEEALIDKLDEVEQENGLIQVWNQKLDYIEEDPEREENIETIRQVQENFRHGKI